MHSTVMYTGRNPNAGVSCLFPSTVASQKETQASEAIHQSNEGCRKGVASFECKFAELDITSLALEVFWGSQRFLKKKKKGLSIPHICKTKPPKWLATNFKTITIRRIKQQQ